MNRSDGSGAVPPLADERKRVLAAVKDLGCELLTGPVIFRRMHERSTEARPEAGPNPGDQSLLYPALHSLEADWSVQATWLSDANGIRHRTYRKRRLLSRRLVRTQAS
ncbi:MAG: hypothetical protein ABSA21_12940 [Candidatus Limnocylindrales bacterium]|jgi:hypothetical protein